MVARVRPAHPDHNITDELLVEALGACAATYRAQEEASDAAKTARSNHSAEIKKWKGRGVNTEALKRATKERFADPAEVIATEHAYIRMRSLQNMPSFQQDLVALWTDIDLTEATRAEMDRQRWHDDGAFAGRQNHARTENPHEPGSEAHDAWDRGWLNDQERIARSMGARAARPVNAAKQRPARKKAARAQSEIPMNGRSGRRRRVLQEADVH